MGNDGGWESMDFSPQVETEFIKNYLAPTLISRGHGDVAIYGFDQNIFEMMPYADAIYQDSLANLYTTGMAVHWYGSTIGCFPETLEEVHAKYPNKTIFHSEGCIDNLGCPPWDGVTEPVGFQESGWFNNDAFWWDKIATDWAYSTRWAGGTHPKYSPVFRYAQYIIDGTNHWLTGYCDWNIVLDSIGGPNHVNNFAGAQVMIDYANDIIYYTPYYYVLKQFSRSMRPGDVALQVEYPQTMKTGADCETQDIFLCAVEKADGSYAINILNMGPATTLPIQLGNHYAKVKLPASSVQTIIVKLND
jgi:glucosylceramidase